MSLCPLLGYHALLCTMVHQLISSPFVRRPDLSNCCDSEALFPLHPELWQPSPSMFPPSFP